MLHVADNLIDNAQSVGHYRVIQMLGRGGMGEVYLAEDSKLRRKVALKILPKERRDDEERRKRFEREARALAAINHPNIVTLYSLEEWRGIRFITMEWVDGRTLSEILTVSGPFSLTDLVDIGVQAAEGLAEAHDHGLIHRDLKPQNIMITAGGRAKILDFGLAKEVESVPPFQDASCPETLDEDLTAEGTLIGTSCYMSPEQVLGKELDLRSDIFSMGTVLYEMATATRSFPAPTPVSSLAQLLWSEPRPMLELRPQMPAELDRIVRRCLHKERSRRYSDARSLAQDLRTLRGGLEASEQPGAALACASTRLLVVEDEPALARGLADNFRNEDYEVRIVHRGDEVLPAVAAFRPDLLVLDVMLPGQTGLDVLKNLRAGGNAVPVLMLTAKADLVDRVVGLELGADDYLTKPFAVRELLARVRALLRRRRNST
jgi:CheY-like chemotaxis protein/tRNA A-37 threonylcarbamoyl transferase component Bud32